MKLDRGSQKETNLKHHQIQEKQTEKIGDEIYKLSMNRQHTLRASCPFRTLYSEILLLPIEL